VQWIPPRWDWVDPLKDIQAQVLAMEAGITSRRKVVEATGYDVEEIDRENAADAEARDRSGPRYRTSPGETQGARGRQRGPSPATAPATTRTTERRRPIRPPNRSDDMASWYTIRARGTGAEVLIYDEIGAYGVSAKGFLAELGALPEGTPIDLRLNSPGGSVFDAVAIYNALKRHSGTVTVWIDGIAASAASYVAMAGDEIVMPENAFLMIHDPAGLVMGTADRHARHGRGAGQDEGQPVCRLCRQIRPDPEEIAALMAAETWFDAKDALAQGLPTADRAGPHRRALRHSGASAMRRRLLESRSKRIRTPTTRQTASRSKRTRTPTRPPKAISFLMSKTSQAAAADTAQPPAETPPPSGAPPIPPRSGPTPSPMPAPSSISASLPASRRWPAASSKRTPSLDEVRAALLAAKAEAEPEIVPHHPQPGRSSAARPWGESIARTFKLKG
jgi:ATP-dependent Clp protease protease subunit